MFRLARLIILCLIAFIAGVFFERQAQADKCLAAGGSLKGSICEGATHG